MGQTEEFREYFEADIDRLVGFAFRLTGNRAAAEDLAQDAMLKTFHAWRRIRDRERPGVYARAALVNAHRSLLRRSLVAAKHRQPAPAPVGLDEDATLVWAELATLPPKQRAAIVLHYYEDMPQNEIARVLGCAQGTVNSLVFRGLARLRDRLSDDDLSRSGS